MNRRSFLAGLGLTPVAAVGAVAAIPDETGMYGTLKAFDDYASGAKRVSIIKGDAGERLYASCCADGRRITVLLDGVEQKWAETADEAEGFVTRSVTTPEGNPAINYSTGEFLKETVHGNVEIVIGRPGAVMSRVHRFKS